MEQKSAWERLDVSLRRLKRFRELSAPPEIIEKELELAHRFWNAVPRLPAGAKRFWPEELEPLARELGFEPDSREPSPMPPAFEVMIAKASAAYRLSARIAQEVEAAGGVTDLEVLEGDGRIVLRGDAINTEAIQRATQIAARVAPGLEIDNGLALLK